MEAKLSFPREEEVQSRRRRVVKNVINKERNIEDIKENKY